ncbi:MAG: hypothetical protein ACKO3Q_00940 [Betaproteobacteria bacterium]
MTITDRIRLDFIISSTWMTESEELSENTFPDFRFRQSLTVDISSPALTKRISTCKSDAGKNQAVSVTRTKSALFTVTASLAMSMVRHNEIPGFLLNQRLVEIPVARFDEPPCNKTSKKQVYPEQFQR